MSFQNTDANGVITNINDITDDMTLDGLSKVLSTTIVADDTNKCIVFLAMLSAYTEDDQFTVCLLGPSSSGKTYLAQQVAEYFPAEDVQIYANMSPTAFKYMNGEKDKQGRTVVDLERKILIFSEMPNSRLLENLRPVLSHDNKEVEFDTTDVGSGGSRVTRRVIMKGFPSVVFCSANTRLNEQEATRALLLSPESSEAKIRTSAELAILRKANPEAYAAKLAQNTEREALKEKVKQIRGLRVGSVLIPDPSSIAKRFIGSKGRLTPKDMREATFLTSLIKATALLNAQNRLDEHNNVVATESDVEAGFKLWNAISETQGSGIVPAVNDFFKRYVVPAYLKKKADGKAAEEDGVSLPEIMEYIASVGDKAPANFYTLGGEFMPALVASSLVTKEQSVVDRRRKIYKPLDTLESIEPRAEQSASRSTFDGVAADNGWDGGSVHEQIDFDDMEF